jgi:hypothetical protein
MGSPPKKQRKSRKNFIVFQRFLQSRILRLKMQEECVENASFRLTFFRNLINCTRLFTPRFPALPGAGALIGGFSLREFYFYSFYWKRRS